MALLLHTFPLGRVLGAFSPFSEQNSAQKIAHEFRCQIIGLDGAARGIRTPDPVITNDVLYQLSYCGGFRGF